MLIAQGKLDEALKTFRDDLGISEPLAASDRSNTQWQRDLSVTYNKLGDVLARKANLTKRCEPHGDAIAIRERLAAADHGNTEWQRDLACRTTRLATC